jgi:acyl-CoA synthetase (NDP forming)
MVLVLLGGSQARRGSVPGVTSLRTSLGALNALARARKYAEWLETPRRAAQPADPVRTDVVRSEALALMQQLPGGQGWLGPDGAERLLRPYGLVPTGRVAVGEREAAQVAAEVGFPVVVKVARDDIVHKTDRGFVRVGLTSPTEVGATVRSFAEALGADQSVLVQPVIEGVEVAVGLVEDPVFGPMIMVGAGGVGIDLWNDRVFLLPPVTATDALRALRSLRIWPMLAGFRGSSATDVDALVDIVVAVGELGAELPALAELDLNPVLAAPDGCHLVDVKMRLAPPERMSAGLPRQLRQPRLNA